MIFDYDKNGKNEITPISDELSFTRLNKDKVYNGKISCVVSKDSSFSINYKYSIDNVISFNP